CVDDGLDARQVCVTARTNDDVDAICNGLKNAGVEFLRLDNTTPDESDQQGVRVATMHRIKGLEFSVVVIAGYKGAQWYAESFSQDEDAGVTEETIMGERCLLHVAATRAKRNLFVFTRE